MARHEVLNMQPAAPGDSTGTWPRKILLACDGSAHSNKAAHTIAAMVSAGSTVRLLIVAGLEFAEYEGEWGHLSDETERQERLRILVANTFEKPLEYLSGTHCHVQKTTRLGNPTEQILSEIQAWHPDLLVMGRSGLGRMTRLVLGSVSNHLVKHSSVPVLIVP